jgi:hypothetical protein
LNVTVPVASEGETFAVKVKAVPKVIVREETFRVAVVSLFDEEVTVIVTALEVLGA